MINILDHRVTVFGAGYVGLVTGVCFAECGYNVVCVDTDKEKVVLLQQGVSPIYEPGMDALLTKNIAAGRVSFTSDIAQGVEYGDLLFIAVGTPSATYGSADLHYIYAVARTIGQFMNKDCIVVDKSTVPVGTGDKVAAIVQEELDKRGVQHKFAIVSNPEFLKQGDAIKDFMHSDRVIIGADDPIILKKMRDFYAPLNADIVAMDIRSAELAKYAANAFLATKISFINELAMLAERFGADITAIKLGIGSDPRIGMHFLNAGCGYGGSCFPKDVKALIWMARESGVEVPLFDAVENINVRQKCVIFNRLRKYFNNNLRDKVIAMWGLAFKPNTDDMRDAPSKVLMELLWQEGAIVQAYDPVAMREAQRIYGKRPDLVLCSSKEAALEGADALAIVTEWEDFKTVDFAELKRKLRKPLIFDGRNIFEPGIVAGLGIEYFGIGRSKTYERITAGK